jgi:hypothetical protein
MAYDGGGRGGGGGGGNSGFGGAACRSGLVGLMVPLKQKRAAPGGKTGEHHHC